MMKFPNNFNFLNTHSNKGNVDPTELPKKKKIYLSHKGLFASSSNFVSNFLFT